VSGRPAAPRAHAMPPWLHALPGVEFRFRIDAAAGVMLRAEGLLQGTMVSWIAIDELVVDQPIADHIFDFTPIIPSRVRCRQTSPLNETGYKSREADRTRL
jgi:hypothetical protein